MAEYTFSSIRAAAQAIERDVRAKDKRMRIALRKTARESRNYVKRTVPKAFGELVDSVHVEDVASGKSNVVADAPHAAAVENGSRPHWVPLEALVKWVKLRGMQGIDAQGNVKSNRTRSGAIKNPRREVARYVALALQNAPERNVGGQYAMDVDAPLNLARAIQIKIAREGTKPHHYMGDAVQPTLGFLERFVHEALQDETTED